DLGVMDFMMAPLEPRLWHLIDIRPPLGFLNLEIWLLQIVRRMLLIGNFLPPLPLIDQVKRCLDQYEQALLQPLITGAVKTLEEAAALGNVPPAGVPTYPHVNYCNDQAQTVTMQSIPDYS